MKRYPIFYFFILIILFGWQMEKKETALPVDQWPESTLTTKPWTRWWWMGNAVDQNNLKYLLDSYQSAGFGGVEIAPIYGAKGYEERYISFLSKEWIEMLEFTIRTADSLGMGVDLTQGTGWPFGGPQVRREHAASKLVIKDFEITSKNKRLEVEPVLRNSEKTDAILIAVVGYFNSNERRDLTNSFNENILDPVPEGLLKARGIYLGKTGQLVKRAAPGGEGFTLDHYSKTAVNSYLQYFDSAFNNKFPDFRAFYNDSFEVYGANFTEDFFEEFEKRRGYKLQLLIDELIEDLETDISIRVKSDYRETLHELLLENFTQNWSQWAQKNGKITKNQAHGSPGNLLDLYAGVDIPETETFGSSFFPIPKLRRDSSEIRNVDPDPIMLKFASSAANVKGKKLVSSETFTWLGEHFKSSFSQMKPELDQTFLSGVNHIFYHGTTYSPKDLAFPGWLFYASLNLNEHNPLWSHIRAVNEYINRVQSVLQAGNSDNELIIYWPIYDVWANPKGIMEMISVHHIDKWLHPTEFYKQSKKLMEYGYSLDFVSDAIIQESTVYDGEIQTSTNSRKKTLLIPKLQYMPVKTLESIMNLAKNGASIIFQSKPLDVPGYSEIEIERKKFEELWARMGVSHQYPIRNFGKGQIILNENLKNALSNADIKREKITDTGLKFIRRKMGSESFYFLVNLTDKMIDSYVEFLQEASNAILMNPLNGQLGKVKGQRNGSYVSIPLHLSPGESIIVRISEKDVNALPDWPSKRNIVESLEIKGPWKLTFIEGGPKIPQSYEMENITAWTKLNEKDVINFSGLGIYNGTFDFTVDKNLNYILKIDQVYESAKIYINDQYLGQIWSLPYEISLGNFLKNGRNEIKIEVANLMANHIRYLDQIGVNWRNYNEINFVNIDYQPFDASNWSIMESGISGRIEIQGIKK